MFYATKMEIKYEYMFFYRKNNNKNRVQIYDK